MNFVVQSGIPIPPKPAKHLGRANFKNNPDFKYPWPEMNVGDSFFVRGPLAGATAFDGATAYAKRNGFRFEKRAWTEGEFVGVRIWRVA